MKESLIKSLIKESREKREQAETLTNEANAIDTVLGMFGASPVKSAKIGRPINEEVAKKKKRKYSNSRSNSYLSPRMDVIGAKRNNIDYPKFILDYMANSNRNFCKTTDIYLKLTKKYGDVDRNMYQKVLETMKILKKKAQVEIKVEGNSYTWKITDSGRKAIKAEPVVKRKYTKRAKAKPAKSTKVTKKISNKELKGRTNKITIGGMSVKEIASKLKVSGRTIHRKVEALRKEGKPLTDILVGIEQKNGQAVTA
jgi:hypothetical protein